MQLSFKKSVEEMIQEQVSQFRHIMENLSKENQHFVDKISESTFSSLFGKVFKKK